MSHEPKRLRRNIWPLYGIDRIGLVRSLKQGHDEYQCVERGALKHVGFVLIFNSSCPVNANVMQPLTVTDTQMDNEQLIAEFKKSLLDEVKSTYGDLAQQFDDICGFGVFAPPYIESVFPAYQRSSELEGKSDQAQDKYWPPEWSSFGVLKFGSDFQKLVQQVSERRSIHFDDPGALDADPVFEAILDVLVQLESEGLFGPRTADRYVTMWDVGNDDEWILKSSERLNSAEVHNAAYSAHRSPPSSPAPAIRKKKKVSPKDAPRKETPRKKPPRKKPPRKKPQ